MLTAALPATAAGEAPPAPLQPAPAPANVDSAQARLDKLFSDLGHERNETAAQRIAMRIQGVWSRSDSASIDLMMGWAQKAIEGKKYDMALDFLDEVTTLAPDYAEGWNRRATVHFLMNDYAMSMADIDRTLRLEPRHFGALSGMARILESTGRQELALEAYRKVLAIYPMLREAQEKVVSISDDLAGQAL